MIINIIEEATNVLQICAGWESKLWEDHHV